MSSVLHFGGALFGLNPCTDLELIHSKVLSVKRSTNTAALRGELGRVPLNFI